MDYKYPTGEIVWVSYHDKSDGLRYIITSKPSREYYFLYELRDGKFVKLGKNRDPTELEERFMEPLL